MNFDQYTTYDNEHFLHPWEGMADLGTQERTFSHQAKGIYIVAVAQKATQLSLI